jgi:hypothetical protein
MGFRSPRSFAKSRSRRVQQAPRHHPTGRLRRHNISAPTGHVIRLRPASLSDVVCGSPRQRLHWIKPRPDGPSVWDLHIQSSNTTSTTGAELNRSCSFMSPHTRSSPWCRKTGGPGASTVSFPSLDLRIRIPRWARGRKVQPAVFWLGE